MHCLASFCDFSGFNFEDASFSLQKENEQIKSILNELRRELDESRSEVAILECTKENDIDEERRKCREEIASLQKIIDGKVPKENLILYQVVLEL